MWLLIGLLCIGAGKVRLHYHAYLTAASRNDSHARATMAGELTMIHGVPAGCDEREYLRELQNALLWINFRFYLAPLFWLIVGNTGTRYADGVCVFACMAILAGAIPDAASSFTVRHRCSASCTGLGAGSSCGCGICLDRSWGESVTGFGFASLGDFHTSQYQVLTRLAQFSLAREPHVDKVETPKAAVSMAKKTSFVVVVVIALLTIYGALV